MSQVTVFATESYAVAFADKKGVMHAISAEGALFKGGAALAALKDIALDSALTKAMNGRYVPAADIMVAAFPSIGKAATSLIGNPAANKSTFLTLCNAVCRAEPKEGKKLSLKQDKAQVLTRVLRGNLEPVEAKAVEGAAAETTVNA